jgi:hypothetical protein
MNQIDDFNKKMIQHDIKMCEINIQGIEGVLQALKSQKNYIRINQPIYYYSSYWQHWDEILCWNKNTECIAVREVGTDKIREHCTTIEKNFLSTIVVDRNSFSSYDEFTRFLKKESNKAWVIWRDSGIPRRILKFTY